MFWTLPWTLVLDLLGQCQAYEESEGVGTYSINSDFYQSNFYHGYDHIPRKQGPQSYTQCIMNDIYSILPDSEVGVGVGRGGGGQRADAYSKKDKHYSDE